MKMIRSERGGVSIFIVIFTALLVTVVTASFVQIMLRNQQAATNSDLSQSAYDSALAGVEDAKRALVRLRECENDDNTTCVNRIRGAFEEPQSCESLGSAANEAGVVEFEDGEVQVGDEELNQAYTCVKVTLDTDSTKGKLDTDGSATVIPLRGVNNSFSKIRFSWFQASDTIPMAAIPTYPTSYNGQLPVKAAWQSTWPALMRLQFMQFTKDNLELDELNDNARTLFLYPDTAGSLAYDFATDGRNPATTNDPKRVSCNNSFSTGYACSVIIDLPNTIPRREAYLQLQSLYKGSSYQIELLDDDDDVVPFNAVQPVVDSTGRAADQFRRVRANISLKDGGLNLEYPQAALWVNGNVCKDFFVTDTESSPNLTNCNPYIN